MARGAFSIILSKIGFRGLQLPSVMSAYAGLRSTQPCHLSLSLRVPPLERRLRNNVARLTAAKAG